MAEGASGIDSEDRCDQEVEPSRGLPGDAANGGPDPETTERDHGPNVGTLGTRVRRKYTSTFLGRLSVLGDRSDDGSSGTHFFARMILGSGLIARAFHSLRNDDRVILFASGISNSSTVSETSHGRERDLLLQQVGTAKRLVYFSTCSIFDPTLKGSGYIRHKLYMEELVKTRFKDHMILRLPNVVGPSANPHTLCNHLRDSIHSGRTIGLQVKACRYLIGVDMITAACSLLVTRKNFRAKTVNVCFDHPTPVPAVLMELEHLLCKKAVIDHLDAGSCYEVDNSVFKQHWLSHVDVPWPAPDHWRAILLKYYGEAGPSP